MTFYKNPENPVEEFAHKVVEAYLKRIRTSYWNSYAEELTYILEELTPGTLLEHRWLYSTVVKCMEPSCPSSEHLMIEILKTKEAFYASVFRQDNFDMEDI